MPELFLSAESTTRSTIEAGLFALFNNRSFATFDKCCTFIQNKLTIPYNRMEKHHDVISLLSRIATLDPKPFDGNEAFLSLPVTHIADEAQRQGVAPWICHQIDQHHAGIKQLQSLKAALKPSLFATLAANEMNIALLNEIQALMEIHHIQTTSLKGISLVMGLYPEPSLRPIGDLDLYISPQKVFQARDLLIAQGAKASAPPLSTLHEANHAHVRSLTYKGRLVEFHQRLYDVGNPWNPNIELEKAIEPFTFRGQTYHRLNQTLLAYHLATHLAYNIKMGGCRLGWFVDIALLFSQENENAHLLHQKLVQINPKANHAINRVLGYAMPLMNQQAYSSLQKHQNLKPEVIPSHLLTESAEIKLNHKKIVALNILQTPGIGNKTTLLFREFFPTRDYMNHFYPIQSNKDLILAYLKRLTNIGK